jgi:hypothetical protein
MNAAARERLKAAPVIAMTATRNSPTMATAGEPHTMDITATDVTDFLIV